MIRMEASKPVLSREDYRDIYEHLTFACGEYLSTARDATRQDSHDLSHFWEQRARRVAELMDKVVREASLDEKEGASVSLTVVNAAKKTPPPKAETPETAR